MNAQAAYDLLSSSGVRLTLEGSSIRVEGDITVDQRGLIGAYRQELVKLLSEPSHTRLASLAREHGLPTGELESWYSDPGEREALATMPEDQALAILQDYRDHRARYRRMQEGASNG